MRQTCLFARGSSRARALSGGRGGQAERPGQHDAVAHRSISIPPGARSTMHPSPCRLIRPLLATPSPHARSSPAPPPVHRPRSPPQRLLLRQNARALRIALLPRTLPLPRSRIRTRFRAIPSPPLARSFPFPFRCTFSAQHPFRPFVVRVAPAVRAAPALRPFFPCHARFPSPRPRPSCHALRFPSPLQHPSLQLALEIEALSCDVWASRSTRKEQRIGVRRNEERKNVAGRRVGGGGGR